MKFPHCVFLGHVLFNFDEIILPRYYECIFMFILKNIWALFLLQYFFAMTYKMNDQVHFFHFSVEKSLQNSGDQKEAVLSIGLLRSLLQRLTEIREWYEILHQRTVTVT